jgi:chromosome segregation ATPase
MLVVDTHVMHAQHREARWEHRDWLADVARWREDHRRATAMVESIKEAWDKAAAALEEHARQIQTHEEHLDRHEQVFQHHGWAVDDIEDEAAVAEHRRFEAAHAAARKAHDKLEQLHCGVMAELLELLKLTHPDAVVLETG